MTTPYIGQWFTGPDAMIVEIRDADLQVRVGDQIGWVPGVEFIDLHGKTSHRTYVMDKATFLATFKEWEIPY